MNQSRFRKYLMYAIGEIILVVIGILIALQINQANSDRQDRNMELDYLNNYLQDLEINQQELQRVIKKTKRVNEAAEELGMMILDSIPRGSLIQIDSLIGATNGFTVFMSSEGTIGDIQGSGRLNLISNDSIRRSIATWQADLKGIREWEKLSKDANMQNVNYLNQRVDQLLLFQQDEILTSELVDELFADVYYRNIVYDTGRLAYVLNTLYTKHHETLSRLSTLVENEIRERND